MGRLTALKPRLQPMRQGPSSLTTATTRTRGSTWMSIRERIFERDCGLCVHCAKAGHVTPATQVDHVRPLEQGGTDTDDNLQSLCEPCHEAKTKAEAAVRGGRGG